MGGLYVPDVILPGDGDFELWIAIKKDGSFTYNVSAKWRDGKQKVVPVPPHGRLGDLDKLVEKIDGIWDCNDMVFKPNDHCCNIPEDCKGCKWVETKNFIRRIVANAPTIIPADGKDIKVPTREECE